MPSEKKTGQQATRQVLEAAQKDLQNAEWTGPVANVVDPLREKIISPVLDITTAVLPAVISHVPLLDGISGMVLGVTFSSVKHLGYGLLPHVQPITDYAEEEAMTGVVQAKERAVERLEKEEADDPTKTSSPVDKVMGALNAVTLGLVSYTINSVVEFAADPVGKYREWDRTLGLFISYLESYGIDKEVNRALKNPRTKGNMIIMSCIQRMLDADRRHNAELEHRPLSTTQEKELLQKSSRYMKFSIAAYGVFMIESDYETRNLVADKTKNPEETPASGDVDEILEIRLRHIARYLNIDVKDIKYITPPGGDVKLIGHFVAVDHKTKSVVLAIRGTHSTTEVVTDLDAASSPFCGGVAHKGMAESAKYLHENIETRNAVARALFSYPDYGFVITGQSVGAGVANLLHISFHSDVKNPFGGRKSICYAFASPPVFCRNSKSIKFQVALNSARSNCYNFIHGSDVVPFLSVDSVRRVLNTLDAIDTRTSKMSFWDRLKLVRGEQKPSEELVAVVRNGSKDLPSKPGAERLQMPASFIVWSKRVSEDPLSFDMVYCDPVKVSNICLFMDANNAADHMPMVYEVALENMAGCD